jgi:hypothetical protein
MNPLDGGGIFVFAGFPDRHPRVVLWGKREEVG